MCLYVIEYRYSMISTSYVLYYKEKLLNKLTSRQSKPNHWKVHILQIFELALRGLIRCP